ADDNAGAVVDEEAFRDRRAGMDVDAGLRMRNLRHHPRNVRHTKAEQLMSDAIDGDRFEARVAKDDLVVALRRRVAAIRGGNIFVEQIADRAKALQELDGLPLSTRFAVDMR